MILVIQIAIGILLAPVLAALFIAVLVLLYLAMVAICNIGSKP